MPITKIEKATGRAWGLWKIEEEEYELTSWVSDYETIPEHIRHTGKRLEFIAGRVLVRKLVENLGMTFKGLTKDEYGKPFLKENTHQVSLSHSFPYVAAIIDSGNAAGIDLEQINAKLLKIGPRVLHVSELHDAGQNEAKHCVYWCGKEALMKIYGRRDVVFSENLLIEPFPLQSEGPLVGRIIVEGKETVVKLHYHVIEDFVLVYNL